MKIDLNTKETQEYKQWLALLNEISRIHEVLKDNPNENGLTLARSHAYNLIAGIQILLDLAKDGQNKNNSDASPPSISKP